MICITACNKEKTVQNNDNSRLQDSLTLELNIRPYNKTKLIAKADSSVRDWPMYNSLKNEIERMKEYTIQDVLTNAINIESVVDSLQETVPKKLDTLPVLSRVKILNTKAKFLLQLSEKQKPELNKIMKIAEEYPLEFNALNIQLNEIFIEIPEFE